MCLQLCSPFFYTTKVLLCTTGVSDGAPSLIFEASMWHAKMGQKLPIVLVVLFVIIDTY